MKKICIGLTLISNLLFFGVAFAAQEAAKIQQQADGDVLLGKIIVSYSRMAQHSYKISSNVSVIDKEQILASNAQDIPELLKESLGVHVYDNNTPKSAVVDIRGFGDTATRNVLVLVNDRKINSIDISGPDLSRIPLESVERIEIIRGAGSVLYGDNAVGGVINIITKQGKGNLSGKLGTSYGSYHTYHSDMEVSGSKNFELFKLPNDVSYYLYSKYLDIGGYRENSELLSKDFETRFGYKVSDKLSVDLEGGYHRDDQNLPGGLNFNELQTLGRKGSADPEDFTSSKDRYARLAFDINPWPQDLDFGNFVLDFYYRKRDVYDAFFSGGESSAKRNIDTFGANGKYVFNKTIFDKDVNFVTGIDYYDHENDILGSGSNPDDLTISKTELGVYGFAEYEALDNLFVNGGTRFHKADYAFSQRNVAVDEKKHPNETVSTGGLKYEYAKGSNIFVNFAQTFRFLSTDEWYSSSNFPDFGITPGLNTALKQQTGVQYEGGIKHNFNDTAVISITPYVTYLRNEIFFDPVRFINSNYDKTRRRGIEAGGTVNLKKLFSLSFLEKLEFFSNYTYQDPQFVGGPNSKKDIPLVPRHQASHGLMAELLSHYYGSVTGRYVGSRFAINDTLNATSPIKEYYVIDGKIGYKGKNFEVYGALNNILNKQYFVYVVKSAFSNNKDHFPAPDRNFSIGVDIKF